MTSELKPDARVEQWKDIEGYEGLYKVSDHGRLLSLRTGRISVGSMTNRGYRNFALTQNKIVSVKQAHRVVAKAFIGNSDLQVNHKNNIHDDNRLDNLEYVTNRENAAHYHGKEYPNVYLQDSGRFKSTFMIGKSKRIYVGTFDTKEEAHQAYINKLEEMGLNDTRYISR